MQIVIELKQNTIMNNTTKFYINKNSFVKLKFTVNKLMV